MSRVFVTGSSDGLGLAARLLIEEGHEVVLHGRNDRRSRDALAAAAGAEEVVTGDLSTIAGTRTVAEAVNKLGCFDAVTPASAIARRDELKASPEFRASSPSMCWHLHSDGIDRKTETAGLSQLRHAPRRATAYGRSALDQARLERRFGLRREQALRRPARICRCSALERRQIQCAGARLGTAKMGGAYATDDLRQGYVTQAWLATSGDALARLTGAYFHHQQQRRAEQCRERRRDPGGAARRVPPHLGGPS